MKNKKSGNRLETMTLEVERPYRVPGERIRIVGEIDIDYSVFKKSPAEKELLKELKSQSKTDALRKGFSAEKKIESLKSSGNSF